MRDPRQENLKQLRVNYNLDNITPYVLSDRIQSTEMVYLDWNESSYSHKFVNEKLQEVDLSQYPDPHNKSLKKELSLYTGVESAFIECFNGSDSALDYAFRTLLNVDDRVLIPYPNYTQVNQTIQSLGAEEDYCNILDLEEKIEIIEPEVVYLSNPNNPIGYVFDIEKLINKFTNVIFIVDEAYYEYHTDYTCFDLAYKTSNLIVTRTFSKGLGLAGIRLGYLTTNSYIIDKIKSIKNFKDVSRLAEAAGVIALQNIDVINLDIDLTLRTKAKFEKEVKASRVYLSKANFVLIEHPKYKEIIEDLKSNNILVRDRSKFIDNSIRITIGKPDVMGAVTKIINRHEI